MIDVNVECLLEVGPAAHHPVFRRQDKPAHVATVYRAFNPGFRDANGEFVRLEFVKCGGVRKTSREAIARFARRLTEPDAPEPEPTSPKPSRRVRREQAERETADL